MRITAQDTEFQDGLVGVTKITLTSPLVLESSPTDPDHAASKEYIDQETNKLAPLQHTHTFSDISDLPLGINLSVINKVDGLTSDVQSGVNSKVSKSGDTLTGPLYLSSDPSQLKHIANKRYVDQTKNSAAAGFSVGNVIEKCTLYKHYGYVGNGKPWMYQNQINRNIGLGDFSITTHNAPQHDYSEVVVVGDSVFLFGGRNNTLYHQNTIHSAKIDASGVIGNFTSIGTMPFERAGFKTIVIKNKVHFIGGQNNDLISSRHGWTNEVWTATINLTTNVITWNQTSSLPRDTGGSSVVVTKNKVYSFANYDEVTGARNDVCVATFDSNGVLAPFTVDNSVTLPVTMAFATIAVVRNYIYLFDSAHSCNIYRSTINPDGTIQPFTLYSKKLPYNVERSAVCVFNSVLYLFGGSPDGGDSATNKICSATINEYGELNDFTVSSSTLPVAVTNSQSTIVTKSRVYIITGNTGNNVAGCCMAARLLDCDNLYNINDYNMAVTNTDTVQYLRGCDEWQLTDGTSFSITTLPSLYGTIGSMSETISENGVVTKFKLPNITTGSPNTHFYIKVK